MKLLIIGVCIYFSTGEYEYQCKYQNQTIQVCSDIYYSAGDSIFVNLNQIQ